MSLAGQAFTIVQGLGLHLSPDHSYQEDKQESEVTVQCFRLEGTSTTSAPEQVPEPEVAGSAILSPAQEAEMWDTCCPTTVITTAIKEHCESNNVKTEKGERERVNAKLHGEGGGRSVRARAFRLHTRQIKCCGR